MTRSSRKPKANLRLASHSIYFRFIRILAVAGFLVAIIGASNLISRFQAAASQPESKQFTLSSALTVQKNSAIKKRLWQPVETVAGESQSYHPAGVELYANKALNQTALTELLSQAPMEFTGAAQNHAVSLTLPLPNGELGEFRIEESPVMEPALAMQYPEIKTYRGFGIDDPTAMMRLDWTPQGLHALIISSKETVTIHPSRLGDTTNYVSYYGQGIDNLEDFRCLTTDEHIIDAASAGQISQINTSFGATRRTYRIAIAVTQEYTNAAALGGGTVAGALASITSWLNSVNLIYEREFSVHLNLVASNTAVIYTAEPDPFTGGNNSAMLQQVRDALRDNIGQSNYDVGHLLAATPPNGGGGVAYVGVICNNSTGGDTTPRGPIKGGGVSALNPNGPIGNASDMAVLAHELGHQFGASHSFNDGTSTNNCGPNRSSASAFEPGGGTSIMSYAGVCTGANVVTRPNTDMRFHGGSHAQISAYITNAGSGDSCSVKTSTGNNVPTINAGADFTIPRNTPFTLTATGSDPDPGDIANLTFSWDQVDSGGSSFASPPYSDAGDPSTTTRPIFRSFAPTANPARTFPSLTYILNNDNVPPATVGGFQTAENLPNVTRTINFRCTVRDNRGGVNDDSVILSVNAAAGPFAVTQPSSSGISWAGGSAQVVTWSVANTSNAPVNCANVKISLSTDGGNTFPTVLAASTPNDGTETLTIPNTPTSTARLKIEAVGNIFFDISNFNFTITTGTVTNTETIGVYLPSNQTFYLRNSNAPGFADLTIPYGPAGATPLVGDWDGNGTTTIGVYDPSNQTFYLRNSNTVGAANISFRYGPPGATPLAGDWNGDGVTTIGVYDPASRTFYLRNSNSAGFADLTIPYGPTGATPVVGDWNGDGTTTIGVYDATSRTFYLRNSNNLGNADITVQYGPAGVTPLVGDWNGDGTTTIGVYDAANQLFYLRNSNTPGNADLTIRYGPAVAKALAGNWDGL